MVHKTLHLSSEFLLLIHPRVSNIPKCILNISWKPPVDPFVTLNTNDSTLGNKKFTWEMDHWILFTYSERLDLTSMSTFCVFFLTDQRLLHYSCPMNNTLRQMNDNPRVNSNFLIFFFFTIFSFQQNKQYPNAPIGLTTNNIAQLWAERQWLSLAWDAGINFLYIEVDSTFPDHMASAYALLICDC